MTTKMIDGVLHQFCAQGRHWLPQDADHFTPCTKNKDGFLYTCKKCRVTRLQVQARAREVETKADRRADRKCPGCGIILRRCFFKRGHERCMMCEQQDVIDWAHEYLRNLQMRKGIA